MAWYPRATRLELQPESDAQQAIRPTQLLVHSIVAAWTARRTYEFWRDSTNLESHFGIGYQARDIAQYIGTETRADANAQANRRANGTGAISVETASNSTATDPWNASQVEELIRLGVWAHERHGIPLRLCRSHDDPGFGFHSQFSQWSTSGTACPGPARIKQFRAVVFPGIVARAGGKPAPRPPVKEETDMTPAQEALLAKIAADVGQVKRDQRVAPWSYRNPVQDAASQKSGDRIPDMHGRIEDLQASHTKILDRLEELAQAVAALKKES